MDKQFDRYFEQGLILSGALVRDTPFMEGGISNRLEGVVIQNICWKTADSE